jgi:hypothetical protein
MVAIPPTAEQLVVDAKSTVTCLVCLQQVTYVMRGSNPRRERQVLIVTEHRTDETNLVACGGSGYVSAQGDGRDDVRRKAIKHRKDLLVTIGELRAEMIVDLAEKNWQMAAAMDYYGEKLIRLETQARIWHVLAGHGEWWTSARDAVSALTSAAGNATADVNLFTQRGIRDWFSQVRGTLTNLAEQQTDGTMLAHLLFNI